ncbi:ATP-binding cassette domain-containing protein [Agromyces sp. CFH 90414]|uniref:ATP-binding cassette domain-containing protein n=1 Tax=Agromyces agglutinans TaxID=2662258 RepID=A0A6I2F3I3_9MICO|nr:ATP-binding cassette domain-containing protein [Agromyces agglutinans]MRG60085.1 ATP-binding cassette domain-containing protein [Agromyces agglutinans]
MTLANPPGSTGSTALRASGLRKRYGAAYALDGFDLEIERGAVHGLLGPNGAGKTTAVRCLTTLTEYDEGTAHIDGIDVGQRPADVRRRIGLVGQFHAVDEALTARQNLMLFARLSGLSKTRASDRADQLLTAFELADASNRAVSGFSGGMRRRLDIAASLVLTPAILFLDEPTTGLDPRGRATVWQAVREIAAAGTTVLLTTQYLDEADQLADRISVMDHGRVVAEGTPSELKRRLGGDRVAVVVGDAGRLAEAAELAGRAVGAEASVDADTRTVTIEVADGQRALAPIVRALDAAGLEVDDLALRRPTLDEVFLHLTGPDAAGHDAASHEAAPDDAAMPPASAAPHDAEEAR